MYKIHEERNLKTISLSAVLLEKKKKCEESNSFNTNVLSSQIQMQTSHKTMLFFFKGLWQGNLNGRHKDKGLVSDSLGTKQPLHEVLHSKYKRMCRKRIAKIAFSMLKHRWHHCHSVEVTEPETLGTSACLGALGWTAISTHMPAYGIGVTFSYHQVHMSADTGRCEI